MKSHRLLFVLGLSFVLRQPAARAETASPTKKFIAITAAFTPELEALEAAMIPDQSKTTVVIYNGVRFTKAEVAGKKVIFFLTGMSLVNAAMTTQLALDHFPIRDVLFSGIAGGINPKLAPGDVVIPAQWFYHAEAAYFNQKADGSGYEIAEYFGKPKYPNFGMIFPDVVQVIRRGMNEHRDQASFPADPHLLTVARRAARTLPPLMVGGRQAHLKIGGPGVAGTVFMDNADYRKWIFRVWHADCLDMESTAIAQVCWANETPCLIVRGLSDLAGGQTGKNQEEIYLQAASANAATVLKAILAKM